MISANGRNYYLATALEETTSERILLSSNIEMDFVIFSVPFDEIMELMPLKLKVEQLPDDFKNFSVCVLIPNLHAVYQIQTRNGIVELLKGNDENINNPNHDDFQPFIEKQQCIDNSTIVVECNDNIWREMVAPDKRSPVHLLAVGELKIPKGNPLKLKQFFDCFERGK